MIINLLTLPGSYELYREHMIYHQAWGHIQWKFLVYWKKVMQIITRYCLKLTKLLDFELYYIAQSGMKACRRQLHL